MGSIAVLNDDFSLDDILVNQFTFITLLNAQLRFMRIAIDKAFKSTYCTD